VFAGMLSILGHYSGDSQAFGSFPSFGYPAAPRYRGVSFCEHYG
jgi:hypothetical protein